MDPISLEWNNHNSSLINSLDHFKAVDSFVDVTLVCEGHTVKAHKIILSAGSNVLRRLLLANPAQHPIIILAETKYDTLRMMIDFLYKGKIDVPRNDLNKLLQVASAFEITDLKKMCEESVNQKKVESEPNSSACLKSPDLSGSSPKKKRQRRPSTDSNISIEAIVPKRELNDSACRFEQSEMSPLIETPSAAALSDSSEIYPKIADIRSVRRTSVESDVTFACIKTNHKDASTECDIQPLKELKCNFEPTRPVRILPKPNYKEPTDDSESTTQQKSDLIQKRKRSPIWKYFSAVNSNYAMCRFCLAKLSYRTTVTNLTKHLTNKHKEYKSLQPLPNLPDLPWLKAQSEQLEVFEDIDFDSIEEEAGVKDDEQFQSEQSLDESIPSTSTPCILKIT